MNRRTAGPEAQPSPFVFLPGQRIGQLGVFDHAAPAVDQYHVAEPVRRTFLG